MWLQELGIHTLKKAVFTYYFLGVYFSPTRLRNHSNISQRIFSLVISIKLIISKFQSNAGIFRNQICVKETRILRHLPRLFLRQRRLQHQSQLKLKRESQLKHKLKRQLQHQHQHLPAEQMQTQNALPVRRRSVQQSSLKHFLGLSDLQKRSWNQER